jgi:hypothetical protein
LIRSSGGWSEVLSLRERAQRHAFDQRILGDSEFVQEVKSGLNDLMKRNLRLSGRVIDFDILFERVCKNYDISAGELRSGSRRHKVVKARQVLFWVPLYLSHWEYVKRFYVPSWTGHMGSLTFILNPSSTLWAATLPPWASMIFLAMASPSP